jgi:GNAT superfamily N-acetyltransferase
VTRGWLEPAGAPVLGLGPLGVLPEAQGKGAGTALVHAVLAVAEAAGETLVALLGDPPTTSGSDSGLPTSSASWRRSRGGAGSSRRGGSPARGPVARSGTPSPSGASSGGGPGAD